MLSTILIISISEDSSWNVIIVRSISMVVISFIVFLMNIQIISIFKYSECKTKPASNEKKIYIIGYLCTLVLFSTYHLITVYIKSLGYEINVPSNNFDTNNPKLAIFLCYISLVQYTFIYLIQNFTLTQFEKNQVELELLKLKSKNSETITQLLKQQIKPHFLFNALNTLKSLIKKKPDTAEEYLLRLSDFLRASFANNTSGMSSISEELKICTNYMEMQKIRFGDAIHFQVNLTKEDLDPDKEIPIFSLQPLLENAIKHNAATIENPLFLTISKENSYITVTNNLQFKKSIENSTGSGLANLRERYKIISGDEVIIRIEAGYFNVSIKILDK